MTPVVSCQGGDVLKVSAVNQGPAMVITMSLLRLEKSGQLVEFESSGPRPLGRERGFVIDGKCTDGDEVVARWRIASQGQLNGSAGMQVIGPTGRTEMFQIHELDMEGP